MLKFKLSNALLCGALSAFIAFGCTDNEEIIPTDPDEEYDAVLEVEEGGGNPTVNVTVDANEQSDISAYVSFTSTDTDMRRLYITQNIGGKGEEPYEPKENVDDKADGSIDIKAANSKGFEFKFNLPVPSGVSNGTVVYKFWTTSGKGDFRDETKRQAAGPGTIVLKYGTGANPEAEVKSYENVTLQAPLADGSSSTFISLLDGKVYKINQGEEFVFFWDFGYYYGGKSFASFASTFNYPSDIIDVKGVANVTEEMNHAYFALSSKTSADFDNVEFADDLDFIAKPATERVTNLSVGNIVEFVDQYGKKGLIRVKELQPGYGSGDYMIIDIKVQP